MNKEILERVLDLLDQDRERAALEYGRLHERLTRFFEWNNVDDPAALADEALDRLAKRASTSDMEKGIRSASSFVLGIARHLIQEERRRQTREAEVKRSWAALAPAASSGELERMDEAMRRSLERMEPERRKLIESYYAHSGAEKIRAHQELAAQHGLSLNALRNRVFRLRKELESSVRDYLDDEL